MLTCRPETYHVMVGPGRSAKGDTRIIRYLAPRFKRRRISIRLRFELRQGAVSTAWGLRPALVPYHCRDGSVAQRSTVRRADLHSSHPAQQSDDGSGSMMPSASGEDSENKPVDFEPALRFVDKTRVWLSVGVSVPKDESVA
jgi:hypothetical protein